MKAEDGVGGVGEDDAVVDGGRRARRGRCRKYILEQPYLSIISSKLMCVDSPLFSI